MGECIWLDGYECFRRTEEGELIDLMECICCLLAQILEKQEPTKKRRRGPKKKGA